MVGSRLIPKFQQYLKKGQCQWSRVSSCLFKLFLVWCSYSSSSNSYWRRCRYWYSYFLSRCTESGHWYRTYLTCSSVMYSLSPFRGRSRGLAPSFSSWRRSGPAILMSNAKSNRRHIDHSHASMWPSTMLTPGNGCHIPKFSFQNVNHFSHKKLKISKKNSFILT
jgi:hypothetical protein